MLLPTLVTFFAVAGCKNEVKGFCDELTPCLPRYPEAPYCDLTGDYEPDGIRNTCVPSPFDASVDPPDAGVPDAGSPAELLAFGLAEVSSATGSAIAGFPPTTIGSASAPYAFTVVNVGGSPTGALSVAITGSGEDSFTFSNDTCSATNLDQHAECTISVTYAPQSTFAADAALEVSSSSTSVQVLLTAPDGSDATELTIQPALATLDPGGTQRLTATNQAAMTVDVVAVDIVGPPSTDFEVIGESCTSGSLAPAATCEIDVEFNPVSAGSKVQALHIESTVNKPVLASLGATVTAGLTVSKTGPGASGGTVTSIPAGISCGPSCASDFTVPLILLTATADPGTTFAGWSGGGCSGTGPCWLSLGFPSASVTATFQ